MSRFSEFIVGLVFFGAMAILGYFTIIKGDIFDTREYYSASVIFQEVENLELGNKVLVNGVESGTVISINLQTDNTVRVGLSLYNRFLMYENYEILLKNQTALGGRVITVYPGWPESGGVSFGAVDDFSNLKGATIGDPIAKISRLIDDNRDNLKATIQNIRDFTDKINSGRGTLGKLINDDTIHSDTTKLIGELRDTIEDSREQAPITSFIRAALTAF